MQKIKVTIEVIEDLVNTQRLDPFSSLAKSSLNLVNEMFKNDISVLDSHKGREVITLDKNIMIFDKCLLITGIAEISEDDGAPVCVYTYSLSIDRESGDLTVM